MRSIPNREATLGSNHTQDQPGPAASDSVLWAPPLVIAAAALAVEIPFLHFGTPSGHDVEFHLYSWLEVLNQWKHGILYPRWAGLAHFGYGEPRFIFYPPASWLLGATLSAVFPWTVAASIYIWIVLTAAGLSMFVLARRWLQRRAAIFAAVLYALNPYHLVIVYWRSAFAELLAACLVPLLLMFVLEEAEDKKQRIVPLGIVLAAAWLTNAPAAVMIHYSLALLIAFFAIRERSPRLLLSGAASIALGAGLASFYLVPAVYEQKWVNIGEAVSPGSRPADNFLFIHTSDPDHDAFNRVISWVAVFELVVIFVSGVAARVWRRIGSWEWNALSLWGICCSFLLFPVSLVFWNILPKMRFMQFPWRWLLCLSVIFAIFVSVGFRWSWLRSLVCIAAIAVIVAGWNRVQAPWWDNAADLREMQDNVDSNVGYEGTDEYTPLGADPGVVDKQARDVVVEGPARAAIHVLRWDAVSKEFIAQMSSPDRLALKLFPYPAWRIKVNGSPVEAILREGTGQLVIPVRAGSNQVEIRFVRTWDRAAGGWISVVTGAIALMWILLGNRSGLTR